MENHSVRTMWNAFVAAHPEHASQHLPKTTCFGANEKEADTLAQRIKEGIKKAISPSLLGLQHRREPLPKIGDFTVVTNWAGEAQCIIRTTAVRLRPYFSIDATYAHREGDGDRSLAHWKTVHWDDYTRELNAFGREPRESMIIVCQEFENVF